jgi:hypothetical protein
MEAVEPYHSLLSNTVFFYSSQRSIVGNLQQCTNFHLHSYSKNLPTFDDTRRESHQTTTSASPLATMDQGVNWQCAGASVSYRHRGKKVCIRGGWLNCSPHYFTVMKRYSVIHCSSGIMLSLAVRALPRTVRHFFATWEWPPAKLADSW